MNRFLNNTAILAISAALIIPHGAIARTVAIASVLNSAPRALTGAQAFPLLLAQATETEPAQDAIPSQTVTPIDEPVIPAPQAEAPVEVTNDAPIASQTVTPSDEPVAPAPQAEAPAKVTNDAPIATRTVTPTDDATTAVPQTQPTTAPETQTEEPVAPTAQAVAPAEVTNEEPIATQTVTPTDEPLDPAPQAAAPAEVTNEEPVATQTVTSTDDGTSAAPEAAADESGTEPGDAATAPTSEAAATETVQTDTAQPLLTEEEQLQFQEQQAEIQAERQAEAVTSAATNTDSEAAEVETEAVTEDNSRASSEEFTPQAQASDGGGLSKFEKALLVGLGAVAVGAILKNGDRVVSNSGDRVVVQGDDGLRVLKNDNELLRRPGSDVRTETFSDGSTRTIVTRPNGNQVVTIAAADGRVVQRFVTRPDGSEVILVDDTASFEPVQVSLLPQAAPAQSRTNIDDELALRIALQRQSQGGLERNFSLAQIRGLKSVRELAPAIELDAVTFASGSAAISPDQAEELAGLGNAIAGVIAEFPETVFLIEGHTDAVGQDSSNLALSDRRAESVALAMTEYFNVPPENLITQGYGESALKIQTQASEQANRRAVVRNITTLLR